MTNGLYDSTLPTVSLDGLTVRLSMLDRLPGAFLRRYRVLPYRVVSGTLYLIVQQAPDPGFVDELCFVTGLEVALQLPETGNMEKLIDSAIAAWEKGEQTLVTSGSGGPVADDDLVYLEDLGSLGDSAGFASPQSVMSLSEGLSNGGGAALQVNDFGGSAQPAAAPMGVSGHPGVDPARVTDDLPQVVDLEPRLKSGPQPIVVLPDPSSDPPSAHATTVEASTLDDDLLVDDMDLVDDVDLVDEDEEEPSLEQATLPVSETPIPEHRPARGLQLVVADGNQEDRRRLSRIAYGLGFELEQTERTLDVIQLLEESAPDLVILDSELTGTHAFTLAKQLRVESRFAHTAVVVTSRQPRSWRLVQDLQDTYGINGYLDKPYDTTTLLWVIEEALNAARDSPVQLRDPDAQQAAEDMLARGSTFYRRGAVDEAVDLFQKGIALDPHIPGLHVSLAIALVRQRRPFHAMAAFEEAITLDGSLTTAMTNLALLYEKKGFRHKAFELWARTLHATKDAEKRIELRARIAKLLRELS